MFLQSYLNEIKYLKLYIISVMTIICLSYLPYLFLDDNFVIVLGSEDGLFESLTSISFVIASVLLFLCFLRSKNLLLLGLSLVLLVGAGEEINWGQRMLHFQTPKSLDSINVQHDFNVHNLEIFNPKDSEEVKKTGIQRLLEIEFLFKVFSMVFFVCIPLFFYHINLRLEMNKKIRMPVAPVTIGIFFLISWVIYYSLRAFVLPTDKAPEYYSAINETFEATSAYIYLVVALYFYNRKDDKFLGNDIKKII